MIVIYQAFIGQICLPMTEFEETLDDIMSGDTDEQELSILTNNYIYNWFIIIYTIL